MAKLTKAKARRRLLEARAKFQKVYMMSSGFAPAGPDKWRVIVNTADMEAIDKIVARCVKRIQ